MKKLLTLLLAIGIILAHVPTTLAQDDLAYFEILSPAERQTYQPGDTLEIQFRTHGFKPDDQHGITIRLAERNTWKRARIGYVTQAQEDDIYDFQWIIPENFFERYEFINPSYFKIELRTTKDEKLVRKISSRSLLYIQKTGTAPTGAIQTTATVTDESSEDSVGAVNANPDELQLVARYEFKSQYEPWIVRKLTVVNDNEGDGFDFDLNEKTDVIREVYVRYQDRLQNWYRKNASLVTGKATFTDLNFYIPKRSTANLEIYVDVIDPKRFNETYSGQTFRVGLMDVGNDASTFEAVGQFSGETDHSMNIQVSSHQIEEFVVRSGAPAFELIGLSERELMNGAVDTYEFFIAAGSDIGLGRLVFNVTQDGLTTVDQIQVFKNNRLLSTGDDTKLGKVYLMWDAGGLSCFAHTAQSGAGTGMNCNGGVQANSKLILTFTQEERIFVAEPNEYKLRFNILGAGTGDKLAVRLAIGDDNAKPNIGGAVPTTGKIHNSGFGNELFGNADEFASEATDLPDRNVVWTDRSADSHFFPSSTPGNPPTVAATSSADFTNGYLLKLNVLPTVIFSK